MTDPDAADAIEDLELDDVEADPGAVAGGRAPSSSGPVPIPYPNVSGS